MKKLILVFLLANNVSFGQNLSTRASVVPAPAASAAEWSFSEEKGPSEQQYSAFRGKFPDECTSQETCETNMRAKAKDMNHDGADSYDHCVGSRQREGLETYEAIKACDPEFFRVLSPEGKSPTRAPVDDSAGLG